MIRRLTAARISFLFFAVLILFDISTAFATTFTVTSSKDDFSVGTLRYAIAQAQPGDTININVTPTILLDSSNGPLLVTKSLTINGPGPLNLHGPGGLEINGNGAVGVFDIYDPFHQGVVVNISGVTIDRGMSGAGGGIFLDHATLTLTNTTVMHNTSADPTCPTTCVGNGGGIYNNGGTLTLSNSTMYFNIAPGNGGGAIYNNHGKVTLTNSTLDTNFAQNLKAFVTYYGFDPISNYGGGGIQNFGGTVTVSNSTLSNNNTYTLGGGIYNSGDPFNGIGTVTVSNSTFSGNSAEGAGGAIFNDNTLTVDSSTLNGNLSSHLGGGIYNVGTITVTNSTLTANSATWFGGGVAGGAIYNGGAQFNPAATAAIISSTIVGNVAPGCFANNCSFGGPGGGGICTNTSMTVKSTNNSGSNCFRQVVVGQNATSAGYNLSDDGTCSFLTNTTDQNNTNAGLDPNGLQSNGGPTRTIALVPGSPALDFIPVGSCTDLNGNAITKDQRGIPRPQGTACDIGAYELVVLSVTCGAADGNWHGNDASIACTSTPIGSLVNPSDASFFLSTNVPNGVETANAQTNSHQVCTIGGFCDTAGPIAGNKVDKKPPTWSCGSPDGQWHANDVQIACTASDGGSGLANQADANFAISTNIPPGTETANAVAGPHTLCDAVNNCTMAQVGGNLVDKNPPTIAIASPAAGNPVYVLNQPVASNYFCVDGGSGVASCTGPVASGGTVDTTQLGGRSFTVIASDQVGNTSSLAQAYTVSYNICLLYNPARPAESGSTVPVRVMLCDLGGKDLSAPGIGVSAIQIQQSGGAVTGVRAPGNSNPANTFRFDASLGTSGGYTFNLKTDGLLSGSYQLQFTVSGDPVMHTVPLQIK